MTKEQIEELERLGKDMQDAAAACGINSNKGELVLDAVRYIRKIEKALETFRLAYKIELTHRGIAYDRDNPSS